MPPSIPPRALSSAVLVSALLAGCSGVPYAPGPTFEPSPSTSPTTTAGSAPNPDRSLRSATVIHLRGSVVADDGQTAPLTAQVELGELGPARGAGNRSPRRLSVSGAATLTNPTNRINVPAASVDLVFQAGYPRSSPACRALPPPDGLTWGTYCWYLLGTTNALGDTGSITALQPGEQRVQTVTTAATGLGQLQTPEDEARTTSEALRRPAIVAVPTSPVDYNGTRLRGSCESLSTHDTPTGAATPTSQPVPSSGRAIAASTTTLPCQDLQYIGPRTTDHPPGSG